MFAPSANAFSLSGTTIAPSAASKSRPPLQAKEGGEARLHDPLHAFGAAAAGARRAFAAIDRPVMLEIAELAIRLHIIPQRGSAGLDRLAENSADRRCQFTGPRAHH